MHFSFFVLDLKMWQMEILIRHKCGQRKINGKSQEGRKFESRISFWTLRPTEIGGGGVISPTEKKWGTFSSPQG